MTTVLLLLGAVVNSSAVNGYIDTLRYQLCAGDTLSMLTSRQVKAYSDTVFFDTIPVSNPTKDSIYMYLIHVYPTYRQVEHREIVLGEAFTWCGQTIHQGGTYNKVYKTVHGCDSTLVLVVTEREGIEMVLRTINVIPFCDRVSYNNKTYTETTVFVDTLRSIRYGCDSIATTVLQKGVTFRHHETVYLYAGETLHWHGKTITTAGTYYDQNVDRFGCDSIYDITVYMRAASRSYYTNSTVHSMCEGDSFTWRGIERTISGSYVDTVYNAEGKIDTLYVLQLTVNPIHEINEQVEFSSFPQYYRGLTITGPGTYPVHYTASTGCDSIINVLVNRQAIIHEETATICKGEEYVWRLRHLREPQTYTETIKGSDDKDSVIYILHLNVHSIPETHITHMMCEGDSYVFGAQILTEPGTYRHTYKKDGCDSTVVLSLNLADVDTIVQVRRLNPGETYTWPATGRTYSGTGTYQVTNINRFGCDSITRLVLTLNHVDTIDTVATICPGETLHWHTIHASQTGHYENVETDAHGDMTYYRLDLTVRDLAEKEVSFFICGDETVTFNGKTYDKGGHYYDKSSCDTLYHIIISQTPTQVYQTDAYLDGVHGYHWTFMRDGIEEDSIFADPGTYEFSSPNTTTGCNDIWRLVLSMDETDYHFVEKVSLCEGETFSWRGHDGLSLVPGEAVYTEHLYTRTGHDSIYELQVTVRPIGRSYRTINFCGSTEWKGKTYTTSAIVYDTLTSANGCDSIVEISLRKNEGFFRRDTATIVQGERLIWHGQTITTDGTYEDRQTTQYGCDSIYELHVGIKAATPQTNMITEIAEICEGDYYEWRGHKYYNKGLYPDTVYAQTTEEVDTIYVLNLNVIEVERRREQYFFCENEKLERIYGEDYNAKVKTDSVYRDTVFVPNLTRMGCPDIVYLEIYKYPVKRHTQTEILHPGDTIRWNEQVITHGGDYTNVIQNTGDGGCDSVSILHVVEDMRDEVYICRIDTPDLYPYVWREDTFYTSGIWFDTVFTPQGDILAFYSLDLTITQPYDTTVYLHGCQNRGVVWRGELIMADTTFIDRIPTIPYNPKNPCDSVFHVHIKMDTVYLHEIVDTICEQDLPYILGRQNPDTIWSEVVRYPHMDTTALGCDSLIYLTLRIIPELTKNDSTFVCSDYFSKGGDVTLGNLTDPWFEHREGGRFSGTWQGKWTGVHYRTDTIVYNCDSSYFHHIIMRPSQKMVKDTTLFLCPDDSLLLFWGRGDDSTWFYKDTLYIEHTPMPSVWVDEHHQYHYGDDSYSCDSITRWHVQVLPRYSKDTTAHKLLGDSIWWGGAWRYYTGTYDSLAPSPYKNSLGDTCMYIYPLHLIVDTAYHFRDTVEMCSKPNQTYTHTWFDGHEQTFNVHETDINLVHYYDSLITYDRRDSIYDLCVSYRIIPTTHLFDTICEGTSLRWDIHHRDNSITPRSLTTPGIYYDTIPGINLCDSILILHLYVRDSIPTTRKTVEVSDRQLPYLWSHSWIENGQSMTAVDSLRAAGVYTYTMPSMYGCDSTEVLTFSVHQTHVFRDTVDICSALDKTLTHHWSTGYEQQFNTPLTDDTVYYADTLLTRIQYDSIYVLCVNFHQTYLTEIRDTICEGDRYRFDLHHGNQTIERWVETSGTYWDTVETKFGCDSVIKLRLHVLDRVPVNHTTVHLPDTAVPYVWHHAWTEFGHQKDSTRYLTETGEYAFHMHTSFGCDSIDSLHLFFHKTYRIREDDIVICHDQTPYTWQDRNDITGTCDLTYYALTQEGYDSVRYVHIEVLPILYTVLTDTLCEGDSLRFGLTKMNQPRFLTTSGVYFDTLTSLQHGCDSIIELRLNVYPSYLKHQEVDIADTELPYAWYHIQGGNTIGVDYLYGSGEYHYRFSTSQGCDSIDSLSLRVHTTYLFRDSITICQSETPYTWFDKQDIYETGTYSKHFQTYDGYDSTYVRYIQVIPTQYDTIRYSICEGSSYYFNGKNYSQQGVYQDTLLATTGCEQIVTLLLTVKKPVTVRINADIYEGETYEFECELYKTSGVYRYYSHTVDGCDSITELNLRVHPQIDTVVTICDKDLPYIWVNKWSGETKTLYEAGIYRDDTTIVNGERTFYTLQLNVNRPTETRIYREICENDFYNFNGQSLNVGGEYRDTLINKNGCDSIVILHLNVLPNSYHYVDRTIYYGDTVMFQGQAYREAGNYPVHFTSSYGCDSIIELHLTVIRLFDDSVTVCANELPYLWRLPSDSTKYKSIYESGIYRDTVVNADGKNSYIGIKVNVLPIVYSSPIAASICKGDYYLFKNTKLTEQGVYYDTLTSTQFGCDSIVELRLNVFPPHTHQSEEDIADTELPYAWYHIQGGDTIGVDHLYGSGQYKYNFISAQGCDSIDSLSLRVHTTYLFRDSITICQSETPYTWFDKPDIYETGTYIKHFQTYDGYDSTYVRYIQVIPTEYDTIRYSICEGTSYYFNGKNYTQQGVYRDTLLSTYGCDRIVTLLLTVKKPVTVRINADIYEGETYEFECELYKTSGVYRYYSHTVDGCDSITELNLRVHPQIDTVVTICTSDLPYMWVNKWSGESKLLYLGGTYRDDTTIVNGERTFYTLQLNVKQPTETTIYREICENDIYNFNGQFLSIGGEYRDTLTSINGCDSIVILYLNVLPKIYNIVDRTIYYGDTVMFQGQVYREAGNYPVRFTSSFGCDSVVELHLTVLRLFDDSVTVCANELPYLWRLPSDSTKFKSIYESGIYRDTVVNNQGMMTSIGIKVNVLPIAFAPAPIVATVCEGDYYRFNNMLLTKQGTYYDTLTAVNGCDSIVMLSLQVMPVVHQTANRTIFEGDTVMFYGKPYTTSGIYVHNDTTANGCINTHQLVLTVLKEVEMDTTVYVCENELPFRWSGYEFNQTGDYKVPTVWTDSARVVTNLHLFVREAPYREISINICFGNTFLVNNDVITESGIYDYIIPSQYGCDSIIRYIVSVHNKFERWDTAHISDKQSYAFPADNGAMRYLTIPGDYEYTGTTVDSHCDSIIHLHLVVHPSYYFKDSIEICKSDPNYPYQWKDENDSLIATIYETGTYFNKHLTYRYGFDSIYERKVIVYESYLFEEQYQLGEGEHLDIHGMDISTPGIYLDNLLTTHGCDSVYRIVVNPKRVREFTWTKEICDGDYFELPDGTKLTQTGNYRYVSENKDSIIYLSLTVLPVNYTEERIVITNKAWQPYACGPNNDDTCYSYLYNGKIYKDLQLGGNIFEERIANNTRCDNIQRLIIYVTTLYSAWEQIPLCPGHPLVIHGETITEPGLYQLVVRSKATGELDSLHRVEVYAAPDYDFPLIKDTICQGDTIHVGDKIITRGGHHDITLKTVDGCDSIYHFDIKVNESYSFDTTVNIADYQTYTWAQTKQTYIQAGTYQRIWPTIHNCDSVYTLHLNVVPTFRDTFTTIICEGDEYFWRDSTYKKEGYYVDTVKNVDANFSAIYSLHLIVSKPTIITSAHTTSEVCADTKTIDIEFEYDGAKPTHYSVYFDALAKREKFRDTINVRFGPDMIAHVDMPKFNVVYIDSAKGHMNYVRPDNYTMHLILDNGICGVSQSSDLKFRVNYPSWIIEQNWDDVVAPLKPELNGGYEFSQTIWEVTRDGNVIPVPNNGAGYLHFDQLQPGDEVVMWATRKGDNYALPTCPLVIEKRGNFNDHPIITGTTVYPTQAPRHAPTITIDALMDGQYEIFSSTGALIENDLFVQGQTPVTLPSISGIYFIRTSQDGHVQTHKVLIY